MVKLDLLTYLDEKMKEQFHDVEWTIEWYKKEKNITLYFSLFAEISDDAAEIADIEGTIAENEVIEFEDSLVFFDPEKSKIEATEDYLQVIPFSLKKGLEIGYLETLLAYLKDVLDEGQSDLLDFVTNPDIEEFELNWDDASFEARLAQAKLETKYDQTFIPYPKF
ncbi:DUF3013 family protein [Isobaculum melis]|uniref:DUF3013 family protein n=1 Tax=Isobaculum melis TaxID=142588 RepID=A0A1H9RY53_9LACT|nr:DUF3013 family protein [Isobaculum melis]SER76819.1 Protein of unknown function [Isobaculum melis]